MNVEKSPFQNHYLPPQISDFFFRYACWSVRMKIYFSNLKKVMEHVKSALSSTLLF